MQSLVENLKLEEDLGDLGTGGMIVVAVVSMAQQPLAGQGPLILEVSRSHTVTHHTQ